MKSRHVPNNAWVISNGSDVASIRVPIGGKLIHLPLILTSRGNARHLLKTYPELAVNNKIRKFRNNLVQQ